jgi:hypothetical protein
MTEEQAVEFVKEAMAQIMPYGIVLGIGAMVGAIIAVTAVVVLVGVLSKMISLKSDIDDYRDMRDKRREPTPKESD